VGILPFVLWGWI